MSNEEVKRGLGSLLAQTVALLAVAVPIQIYSGYVISKLWHWFAVPAFHVQDIGIALAIGVSMLIGFLTTQFDYYALDRKSKDDVADAWKINAGLVFKYSFYLGFGWIITKFLS